MQAVAHEGLPEPLRGEDGFSDNFWRLFLPSLVYKKTLE